MKPKILFLDIETLSMELYGWGLHGEMHYGLNQVKQDWTIASWAAKWSTSDEVMYEDVSKQKNLRDDSKILKRMWKLLDEADVICTQNGKAFDIKKLNARFAIHGFKPYSPFKHIDTKQLAKKTFGFTSSSLEYMTTNLGVKYKKLQHKSYPGFELWRACLAGDKKAWAEMKKYNIHDVLALEEVYNKLIPWHNPVDFRVYNDSTRPACRTCGSKRLQRRGEERLTTGIFVKYSCNDCGTWTRDKGKENNLMSGKKKASLKKYA